MRKQRLREDKKIPLGLRVSACEAGWLLTICSVESRAVELGAGACGCRESISRGVPKGEPELSLDGGDWEEGCPRWRKQQEQR